MAFTLVYASHYNRKCLEPRSRKKRFIELLLTATPNYCHAAAALRTFERRLVVQS
jgi:hypothetical protein